VLRQLLNAMIMGTMAALAMRLQVNFYGEVLNERTSMIVLTAGLSGIIAGLFLTPLFEDRHHWLWRWRAGAAFFWVFIGAMTALYVIHYEFLIDQTEQLPVRRGIIPLYAMGRTAAQFIVFSPKYLLFWPLPFLSLLAALVLPGWPRRKG